MVCTQLNLSKKDDITTNCDDNDDHHHELRQCLLKEISNKHVGVLHKQSRCQRHLTLSTCRRQWFWLTKVVLPLSSQQHVVTTPPFLQAVIKLTTSKVFRRQFYFCSHCVFCSNESLSLGRVVFHICSIL